MVDILFLAEASLAVSAGKQWVQIWSGSLSILVFIFLMTLVRQHRLKTSYSLLWFSGWAFCTYLIIWPQWMDQLGQMLGIHYSPTVLLLIILFFLSLICLHITVVLTRLTRHINLLAQEIALLKDNKSQKCED